MEELTQDEQKLSDKAVEFVKINSQRLIERFAKKVETENDNPTTVFTAGSPGSGKTEFARQFISKFTHNDCSRMVHIDADSIRELLPGYVGNNSYIFQKAAVIGVQKIFDHVIYAKKNCVLDGTFSNYEIAKSNVQRCIRHKRNIVVAYLFEDPIRAWEYTKIREKVEGRCIDKELFIRQFFGSAQVVVEIKKNFYDNVNLWSVTKNFESNQFDTGININSIDVSIIERYSKKQLEDELI